MSETSRMQLAIGRKTPSIAKMKRTGLRSVGLLLAAATFVVAVSCSHHSGNSGAATTSTSAPTPTPGTQADLSNVVAIALEKTSPGAIEAGLPADTGTPSGSPCAENLPTFSLVGIDSSGKSIPILNEPWGASYFTVTEDNIIVRGSGAVVSTGGNAFYCCLIAFPRQKGSNPIRCLSETTPGTIGATVASAATGSGAIPPGVATQGNTVYFLAGGTGNQSGTAGNNPPTQLVSWDGVSSEVETLINDPTASFLGVLAGSGAENVCVVEPGYWQNFLCGNPAGNNYSLVPATATTSFQIAIQVGPLVMGGKRSGVGSTGFAALSLVDLSVTASVVTGKPLGAYYGLFGFPNGTGQTSVATPDGGVLALGGADLFKLGPGNSVVVVDTSGQSIEAGWTAIVGSDDYAFALRQLTATTYDVRQINLATNVVGTTNYLTGIGLLGVDSMDYAATDIIVITGTETDGQLTSIYIDTITGQVTSAPSGPQYTAIQAIQ